MPNPSFRNSGQDLMGAQGKYSVLDHGGLEVVGQHDAPEVVPGSSPPPINRKSSLLYPEPYHAAPYYHTDQQPYQTTSYYGTDQQKHGSYFGHRESVAPAYSPTMSPNYSNSPVTTPSYINPDVKEPYVTAQEISNQKDDRRCCGMRRKVFTIVVVVIAVLVCIAAVVGGVLGYLFSKGSSSNTAMEAMSSTGLATTLSADGTGRLLVYFQDPQGRVIEDSYLGGKWSLEDRDNVDISVVTTKATAGSPLAAISYKHNGKTYRQVFFVTPTGVIMTTTNSETSDGIATNWSAGKSITDDRVAANSIGLAACWSDELMNGIRAFYPSQLGYMQEVKWNFGDDNWQAGQSFDGSDASSGVGCAVKNNADNQFLNVYMRYTASGKVNQVYVDYMQGDYWWTDGSGPTSWSNHSIATGSDIAVCNDESQTEYVYYQMQGGLVARGVLNPSKTTYESFENMHGASVQSKLACAFVDGGSLLTFQNRSSASTIWATDVSRSGISISDFAIP